MEISEKQAEFEDRWFARYDCSDVIGNWEILAYAMLFEHSTNLFSNDDPDPQGRPKGGRKKIWHSERLELLLSDVERVRTEPNAPKPRQSGLGALRYLITQPWFREKFEIKRADGKALKTLANRLSEAEELRSPGNGVDPNPGSR